MCIYIYKTEIIFASIIVAAIFCCINLGLYNRECGSNKELSVIKLMLSHCFVLCISNSIQLLLRERLTILYIREVNGQNSMLEL
jgi:hypothetical protein